MNKEQRLEAEKQKQEAISELKQLFKKANYTAFTQCESVARSGMSRHINVYLLIENSPLRVNHLISRLGLFKRSEKDGSLVVGGCGMDMGFHVVYETSSQVFSDRKENKRIYASFKDYRSSDAQSICSGGYIVRQRWL